MRRPHVLWALPTAAAALVIAAPRAAELVQTAPTSVGPGPAVVDQPESEAPTPAGATAIETTTSVDGPGELTVGSPFPPGPSTTVDESLPGAGVGAESPPDHLASGQGPSTASNSIANGPLPVDIGNSGLASWYDAAPRTTASRDYPRGTRLRVCRDGACVLVTVDDYGPEAWTGRSLDLSADSFAALAPLSAGVARVTWQEV